MPDAPEARGGRSARGRLPQPATPAGGIEAGDAPWRRAARMTGAEPGGAWETAPLPVVAEAAANEPRRAGRPPRRSRRRSRTDEMPAPGAEGGRADRVVAVRRDRVPGRRPGGTAGRARVGLDGARAAPARSRRADSRSAPVDAAPTGRRRGVRRIRAGGGTADGRRPGSGSTPTRPRTHPGAEPVSRPLSDPDLTPLMGIPIIRPVAGRRARGPRRRPRSAARPGARGAPTSRRSSSRPPRRASPTPSSPTTTWSSSQPSARTGSFPVVRPRSPPVARSRCGSGWSVATASRCPRAVVALLDDHGREADAAKTAVDGGGELHSPHAGRFLMIVSADGFQPRAAILTVDEQPVEFALLLPRLGRGRRHGALRGAAVRDARGRRPGGRGRRRGRHGPATAATGSTTWPRARTPCRRDVRAVPWRGDLAEGDATWSSTWTCRPARRSTPTGGSRASGASSSTEAWAVLRGGCADGAPPGC